MAAATVASPKISPQRPKGLLRGDDDAGAFVAGGDELEEQVGGFGFEGDVADFVDDEQRVAAEAAELVVESAGGVGVGEAVDPFGGGGEGDAVAGVAGADAEADGEVGLAGAGRAEEHDVVAGGDEVEGAEVGDDVAFEGALVVEVELVEGLAGREAGGADAELAAVGLAGGDLAFEAGGEELLVGPAVGAGPFGEPLDRGGQRRCLQRPAQVGEIAAGLVSSPSRRPGGPVVDGEVAFLDDAVEASVERRRLGAHRLAGTRAWAGSVSV